MRLRESQDHAGDDEESDDDHHEDDNDDIVMEVAGVSSGCAGVGHLLVQLILSDIKTLHRGLNIRLSNPTEHVKRVRRGRASACTSHLF